MRATSLLMLLLLTAPVVATGCAGAKITAHWKAPKTKAKGYQRVLVVGVVSREEARLTYEGELVERMGSKGFDAITSTELLPPDSLLDPEIIHPTVEEKGIDAVLVTRVIGKELSVQPKSSIGAAPETGLYSYWYGTIPSLAEFNFAIAETRLFDVASQKSVWAARTKTFEKDSLDRSLKGVGRTLVRRLKKEGLLR